MASSTTAHGELRETSNTARQPTGKEKSVTKKTIYLNARAAQILAEIARKETKSETRVVNDAIVFYDGRGQFLEELIKRSAREALQEFTTGKWPNCHNEPVEEIQEVN
jgi:hypothetical protein